MKLVLGVLTEPSQLLRADERQQSWFQTETELQGQPQVGMSRREGEDLGAYVALDAAAANELKMVAPGLGITLACERLVDEGDQRLGPLCPRVEASKRRWLTRAFASCGGL